MSELLELLLIIPIGAIAFATIETGIILLYKYCTKNSRQKGKGASDVWS